MEMENSNNLREQVDTSLADQQVNMVVEISGPAMWLRISTKSTMTEPTDIKTDWGSSDR